MVEEKVKEKKSRIYTVYAEVKRNGTDTNIVQLCKRAGVSRNFFYDTIKSVDAISNNALCDLIDKTEDLAARIDMQSPVGAICSILEAALELRDATYIVMSDPNTEFRYREFLMRLIRELVCDRMWNTPFDEYEYDILTMKSLFLMYRIKVLISQGYDRQLETNIYCVGR